MDDAHLLITKHICTKAAGTPSTSQIAVTDLNGKILASINEDAIITAGPNGQVLIRKIDGPWELLDQRLQKIADLPAHRGFCADGPFLSPSREAVSLCTSERGTGQSGLQRYELFAGNPLTKQGELNAPKPFPGILGTEFASLPVDWKVNARDLYRPTVGEIWFFENGGNLLARRSATGIESLLPEAQWLAPHHDEVFCDGQLSAAEPRRFLARCTGSIDMFGGSEMPIHTWNHLIVYDVTGQILFKRRVSGHDVDASISPKGHLVAISHGASVDLYTLP